jgi:hypothetical protein
VVARIIVWGSERSREGVQVSRLFARSENCCALGGGPKAPPRATRGRISLYRKSERHFFIFKSLPLKVLTIAAINPSCVS